MSIAGMYMLNTDEYESEKIQKALDMLYVDRVIEFRELSLVLLTEKALQSMPHWKEFVLNFCMDVEEAFKTWTGKSNLTVKSPQKALTLLRQLAHDKTTMNQLTHMLNLSCTISIEFRELYKRLK
ncbi:MAG: hypothetical protein IIB02_07535 [Thaumarchaeota archaeon]|nr:hypothetical protein [Nitrososphaerota archaeon]